MCSGILVVVIAGIGTLTTVGLSSVNGAINPYTIRALGFSLVLCLCITIILLRRQSVKVPSSKQSFLLVGAITFLSVGDILYAHAAVFTPLHTLQGLFMNWAIIGSLVFLRFFCRRHLTVARVLCMGVCTVGCTLAAQPDWFSSYDETKRYQNHSVSHKPEQYVEINSHTVVPLKWGTVHRHVNMNISSLKIPSEPYNHGDYFIGCTIASVSGLFHGAWLTVVYIMSDIPVTVLIFWSCLTCSSMSVIMMVTSDMHYFPYCSLGVTFLILEAIGTGFTMVGAAVAARLTNPIVVTSILSISLLLNYPAAYLPTGGYNGKLGHYILSWTEILGCLILIPGIATCIFLEVKWQFFILPKLESTTKTVIIESSSKPKNGNNKPGITETFV